MIDMRRLQQKLDSITYKPNFKFALYKRPECFEEAYLSISMQVPNVNKLSEMTTISSECVFDIKNTAMPFEVFVLERIRHIEMHEVDEWFKVHGVCLNEPHPELKNEKV